MGARRLVAFSVAIVLMVGCRTKSPQLATPTFGPFKVPRELRAVIDATFASNRYRVKVRRGTNVLVEYLHFKTERARAIRAGKTEELEIGRDIYQAIAGRPGYFSHVVSPFPIDVGIGNLQALGYQGIRVTKNDQVWAYRHGPGGGGGTCKSADGGNCDDLGETGHIWLRHGKVQRMTVDSRIPGTQMTTYEFSYDQPIPEIKPPAKDRTVEQRSGGSDAG
jgi:hypothetical protein